MPVADGLWADVEGRNGEWPNGIRCAQVLRLSSAHNVQPDQWRPFRLVFAA